MSKMRKHKFHCPGQQDNFWEQGQKKKVQKVRGDILHERNHDGNEKNYYI